MRLSVATERLWSAYHLAYTQVVLRWVFRRMGARSRIINPIMLVNTEFAEIGGRVLIRNGARIELIVLPNAPAPRLTIGDRTSIEQNAHIVCQSNISIGHNVSITPNCTIVDVTHPYRNSLGAKIGDLIDPAPRPVVIEDGAFIGAGSIILPGATIGKGAVVGAGSIVTGEIPSLTVAAGRPAIVIRRFDAPTGEWKKVASNADGI